MLEQKYLHCRGRIHVECRSILDRIRRTHGDLGDLIFIR
ncbi:hypothetical protein PMIN01_10020 [Paraphaeosphaeria minitans]|uniref:Uncharacterized protein n=1 Tax=Paraphaeosphaeria minitans TaxID=565426 RepID=A0A9P6GBC4_9PLEO|nr:hypothetical protein PMIN01_10020 [Paraphaeosphaeria minitans]